MKLYNSLKNMKQFKYLLSQLVGRDFKVKYKRSVLGVLWSLLNPLLMMTVMSIVFSTFFKFKIPGQNYLVYLMTGLVIFNFFSEATNLSMSSIVVNFNLITKVYLPKYIFPLSKVLLSLINLGFALIALYFVIIFTGQGVSIAHLFLPFGFICLFVFALGVSLFLSAFSVFFRDMFYIYGIVLMTWTYLTPIMWPFFREFEKNKDFITNPLIFKIFTLNPMFQYIDYARIIILEAKIPSLSHHLICLGMSLATLAFGVWFFRRKQDKFIYYI
jgi:ABC-2 type transport system permease protein